MSKKFLFSSAVLFIGGTLLAIIGLFAGSDFFFILSAILMLMGGIPLLCVWFKEFFTLYCGNEVVESTHTSNEEKPSNENS